jgi:hypothetical protein
MMTNAYPEFVSFCRGPPPAQQKNFFGLALSLAFRAAFSAQIVLSYFLPSVRLFSVPDDF